MLLPFALTLTCTLVNAPKREIIGAEIPSRKSGMGGLSLFFEFFLRQLLVRCCVAGAEGEHAYEKDEKTRYQDPRGNPVAMA